MIEVTAVLFLVWMHLFADFFLQNDKMALNKSTSNYWLAVHVSVYILPFSLLMVYFPIISVLLFMSVNWLLHFATDWYSSRVTSKLWKAGKRHWFFAVIGVDQALHMTALFLTYVVIFQ